MKTETKEIGLDPYYDQYEPYMRFDPEPDHGNQWLRWLENGRHQINQFELLHIMRPLIERVLRKRGFMNPPSQSYRAQQAVEMLKEVIKSRGSGGFAETKKLMRDRDILQDFLAVHRTVWILEGKPL